MSLTTSDCPACGKPLPDDQVPLNQIMVHSLPPFEYYHDCPNCSAALLTAGEVTTAIKGPY